MADGVPITPGSGVTIATDDAGASGQVQLFKLAVSTDGSAALVPADGTTGIKVDLGTDNDVTVTGTVTANAGTNLNTSALATETTLGTTNTEIGGVTEAAPATDTASSGLNGRLQRIAQRLTSLIALLPTSLGQKAKAASLAVTLASDQDALPVTDNSGTLTVDAPVGTPVFVRLSDGAAAIATLPVSLASAPTTAVTLAAGATAIAKAEDVASADADVGVPALAVRKATPANTSGTDGDYEFLQMSAGRLWTSATVDAALPAGTNAIGKLAANSGVDIGDVDVTSVPVPLSTTGGGTEAAALRVTLATDSTGVVSIDDNGGSVTVDAASLPLPTGASTLAEQQTQTTALQLIDNLVLAEDAAHVTADPGVQALAVRKATPANLSGADGDYEPLQVSAGRLWASATVDAALPAGTALIGNTGHKQTRISVTPTVSTSPAYTAKDAVGGIMTFANAAGVSGGTGLIQAVTVVDLSQQMPALDLVLFDQTIAGTVTDNTAFDPTDGDLANVIAVIPIAAWADFNDNAVAHRGGLAHAFKAAATSIFGALVARGTPTFVGTSDIVVILEILQDA